MRSASAASPRPSVRVADPARPLGPKAAFRLDAAADLLQAPARGAGGWGMVIKVQAGESWHQAVLRNINAMSPADQDRLKGLVDWVQDYELGAMPAPAARPAPVASAPAMAPENDPDLLPLDLEFAQYDDEAVAMALMSVEDFQSVRPRGR